MWQGSFARWCFSQGGITRSHHSYGPPRLPIRADASVMDSRRPLSPSILPPDDSPRSGLPSSWHNFRRPLPPITPDRPTAAHACCFTVGPRLHQSWAVDHGQMFNEAETGSRFRIAADVFADTGTGPFGSPLPTPRQLHVKQAIHMANSFQLASCAKLRLAYQEPTETTEE